MSVHIDCLFDVIAENSKTIRLRWIVNLLSEHFADMLSYRLKQLTHVVLIFPRVQQEVLAGDKIPTIWDSAFDRFKRIEGKLPFTHFKISDDGIGNDLPVGEFADEFLDLKEVLRQLVYADIVLKVKCDIRSDFLLFLQLQEFTQPFACRGRFVRPKNLETPFLE